MGMKKKMVKVHMLPAQNICYVRIYDHPPKVSDQQIATVLSKYDPVKHVVREKFSAELGVYIDVKQEIPSSPHLANRKGSITYQGNKDKCFICNEEGHLMASCLKRKVRNQLKVRQEKEQRVKLKESYGCTLYTGGPATTVAEPEEDEKLETREEEIEEATKMPEDDEISEDETKKLDSRDRALIKLADFMPVEISNKQDAQETLRNQTRLGGIILKILQSD